MQERFSTSAARKIMLCGCPAVSSLMLSSYARAGSTITSFEAGKGDTYTAPTGADGALR
jgi:hypothetical protein